MKGAGPASLIGVVFCGSLLWDQDRQLRGAWMSKRDSRRTTANSHARLTGKCRLWGVSVARDSFIPVGLQAGDKDTLACLRCSRV